ncbi:MAG: homoserine kinase [Candidatus Geothermarchaeales archaeon]
MTAGDRLPNRVVVEAPSTTANLGPGFDVFGLALDLFHDIVEVSPAPKGLSIEALGKYGGLVPERVEENTAGVVARLFLEKLNVKHGLSIGITKGIKPGVGLGSSAASAAATAIALNRLLDAGFSKVELVKIAARGESASAGVPHYDNVAPAIFGGFTIVRLNKILSVVPLTPPRNLEIAVVIPDVAIPRKKTEAARSILPRHVPLQKMVQNLGNASAMIAGFLLSDIDLIGRCMIDEVVEPARAPRIPGYLEVKKSALESGALGVAISGAGPSMIAVVDSRSVKASEVAEAMKDAFEALGVEAEAHVAKPSKGARVLEGF